MTTDINAATAQNMTVTAVSQNVSIEFRYTQWTAHLQIPPTELIDRDGQTRTATAAVVSYQLYRHANAVTLHWGGGCEPADRPDIEAIAREAILAVFPEAVLS